MHRSGWKWETLLTHLTTFDCWLQNFPNSPGAVHSFPVWEETEDAAVKMKCFPGYCAGAMKKEIWAAHPGVTASGQI